MSSQHSRQRWIFRTLCSPSGGLNSRPPCLLSMFPQRTHASVKPDVEPVGAAKDASRWASTMAPASYQSFAFASILVLSASVLADLFVGHHSPALITMQSLFSTLIWVAFTGRAVEQPGMSKVGTAITAIRSGPASSSRASSCDVLYFIFCFEFDVMPNHGMQRTRLGVLVSIHAPCGPGR